MRAMANCQDVTGLLDFRCLYLHVASPGLTSLICDALVYCFCSFLLQIPGSLQVFAFEGQNIIFTVNMLLTCILYCGCAPGCN